MSAATKTRPTIDPAIEALVARIDSHLAAMPTERSLISVDEHTDVLLDIRLLATANRPAAGPVDEPADDLFDGGFDAAAFEADSAEDIGDVS